MAIRLAVWFILLASLPILVLAFFVRSDVADAFLNLDNQHNHDIAALLAEQIAHLGSDNHEAVQRLLLTLADGDRQAFVLSRNGTYLAHVDGRKIDTSAEDDFTPSDIRTILSQRDGVYRALSSPYIFAFTPVPGQDAVVAIAVRDSKISDVILQLEKDNYLVLFISMFIILVGSGVVIWLLIGLPVRKLTRAAEQLSAGQLDVQVDPNDMLDDLAVLGTTFNTMVNRIRELVENLEQRVRQRTAELIDANEKLEGRNKRFQQTNQKLAHEIAERSQVEQILQLSQRRYSLATQAAQVGVWDWNLQTGEFYLDPNIKAILGYSDGEIPNDLEVWTTYIHPDDLQPVMEAAQAHLDGQTPEYIFEHRMLHKDGSVRWIFVHGQVIKDEQGQAIRMVGTDTDITGRKEAEEKLKRQIHYAEALAACSRTLLMANRDETENRHVLREALKHLVEPARASKVFLFENFDDPELGFCSRFILDVCAPGIPSALDDPNSTVIPWSIAPDENRRRLASGQPVGGPIRRLFADTPPFRDLLLNNVGVLSVQFFPIHFGGYWWGYIGYDDRVNEREWQEEEILLLGTAAEILSGTLQRWAAEDKLRTVNDRLERQVKVRTAELSETIELLQQEIKERERAQAETQHLLATLEQRIAARTQELSTLFDLIVLASRAANLTDVFQQAIPRILEITRSRIICLHLFDDNRAGLVLAAQQNLPGDARRLLQTVELTPAFQRWLQQPNDPLVTTTLSNMTILPPVFRLPASQTYLGTQIRVGNRIEGILTCYRFTDRGYALDEISLVTALAEQMGIVLETHRLRRTAAEVAVLEERQRLARDLHDSVTQSIYSLTLFARSGQEAAEDGDAARLTTSLTELERHARHALQEMRLLLYELRPPLLEQEGLVQALDTRLNLIERRAGLQVSYQADFAPRELSKPVELELYRVAIEALNNIVKHADAGQVTVSLQAINGSILMNIGDDGCGFDLGQAADGFGLRSIRERVEGLGGTLDIASAPGRGTKMSIMVDLADE